MLLWLSFERAVVHTAPKVLAPTNRGTRARSGAAPEVPAPTRYGTSAHSHGASLPRAVGPGPSLCLIALMFWFN